MDLLLFFSHAREGLRELVALGGPAIVGLMVLSVGLYGLSFYTLVSLNGTLRRCRQLAARRTPAAELAFTENEVREMYRRYRRTLNALVAAAPLLGLLGTVSGMSVTFAALASSGSEQSMEALAAGISEVLLCTEAGLAIALPGLAVIYAGHRLTQKCVQALHRASPS